MSKVSPSYNSLSHTIEVLSRSLLNSQLNYETSLQTIKTLKTSLNTSEEKVKKLENVINSLKSTLEQF